VVLSIGPAARKSQKKFSNVGQENSGAQKGRRELFGVTAGIILEKIW